MSRQAPYGEPMPDEHDLAATLASTRSHEAEFLGLTEAEARHRAAELHLLLRVIAPGDAVTLDLRPDRMTVVMTDSRVVDASAG